MKFDYLDQKMHVFEELNDQYVLPDIYIVARYWISRKKEKEQRLRQIF